MALQTNCWLIGQGVHLWKVQAFCYSTGRVSCLGALKLQLVWLSLQGRWKSECVCALNVKMPGFRLTRVKYNRLCICLFSVLPCLLTLSMSNIQIHSFHYPLAKNQSVFLLLAEQNPRYLLYPYSSFGRVSHVRPERGRAHWRQKCGICVRGNWDISVCFQAACPGWEQSESSLKCPGVAVHGGCVLCLKGAWGCAEPLLGTRCSLCVTVTDSVTVCLCFYCWGFVTPTCYKPGQHLNKKY